MSHPNTRLQMTPSRLLQPPDQLKRHPPQALADKVIEKVKKKEKFRLFLLVPEHPEGNMHQPEVSIVVYWQLKTLAQCESSMIQQIQRE